MAPKQALADKRVARSEYAQAVLRGERALSGADIVGKARDYGGSYHRMRVRAAHVCRDHGGHIRRGPHGKLSLVWKPVPEGATKTVCAVGVAWAY